MAQGELFHLNLHRRYVRDRKIRAGRREQSGGIRRKRYILAQKRQLYHERNALCGGFEARRLRSCARREKVPHRRTFPPAHQGEAEREIRASGRKEFFLRQQAGRAARVQRKRTWRKQGTHLAEAPAGFVFEKQSARLQDGRRLRKNTFLRPYFFHSGAG